MKLPLSIPTLLLFLITFAPVVTGQSVTCSCQSPDEKCTPSIRCPQGCTALCGSNDACYASCGSVEADKSHARISLKVEKMDSEKLSADLTSRSGRKIKFTPRKKADLFSFQLNNEPVWKALKFLAKRGTVLVDGTNFEKLEDLRRKMQQGKKVAVNFTNVPVRNALAKLSFVSGMPFRVESGDDEKIITISLQEATLSEIVSRISAEGGVKIERTEERASNK